MRIKAIFLSVVNDRINSGKIEVRFFAVDLHLRLRQRGLKTVGCAFIVGAEDHCVIAGHFEAQLVVVLTNGCGFLVHDGVQHAVGAALVRREDFRFDTQFIVIDVQGKRAVPQHRCAIEHHVVTDLLRGADAQFDAVVRRVHIEARLRRGTASQKQRSNHPRQQSLLHPVHRSCPFTAPRGNTHLRRSLTSDCKILPRRET